MGSFTQVHLENLIGEKGSTFLSVAVRMCGRETGEDAFQNACISALRNIGSFRGESSLSTWFYTILLNSCRRQMGIWGKIRSVFHQGEYAQAMIDNAPGNDIDEPGDERLQGIMTLIEKLPVRQREAMILRFSDELKMSEIAAVMGCSEQTVKVHIHRGVSALRKAMNAGESMEAADEYSMP
ncbi:RNA polymerase sigma factor [Myxococcota bacterium]|nr:RNA polymerase sigma factor [Myxococcota bacterium]MBU1380337.1 RNA polymerase sigma factor [Myxococcota bacterium]MBU1497170.1 RNA polymerase sigma factor [Myxococcota bacterium]